MINKTIMVLVIAAAFVAGTITTGIAVVYAEEDNEEFDPLKIINVLERIARAIEGIDVIQGPSNDIEIQRFQEGLIFSDGTSTTNLRTKTLNCPPGFFAMSGGYEGNEGFRIIDNFANSIISWTVTIGSSTSSPPDDGINVHLTCGKIVPAEP